MKQTLTTHIVKLMDTEEDVKKMVKLLEQNDYDGNDCFWYLDEYDVYEILDTKIMDRVITAKWEGKYNINCGIMDYSTSYTMMQDKYKIFATDRVFSEIKVQMTTTDCRSKTHWFKFKVWQNSMMLRF